MSTVNDFPIPNGSRIKIVKLSEDTYCIGEVQLYNKKPCGFNALIKTTFKSPGAAEHFIHTIYAHLIGTPENIVREAEYNVVDINDFINMEEITDAS